MKGPEHGMKGIVYHINNMVDDLLIGRDQREVRKKMADFCFSKYQEGYREGSTPVPELEGKIAVLKNKILSMLQTIDELVGELQLHGKLQPMDTAPKDKHFILLAQQKGAWVDFYRCYWKKYDHPADNGSFYIDQGGTEISEELFNLLGWLPLPEDMENL